MRRYETVFSHSKFDVLKTGDRYYLKLKGGIRYASPGLTRITEEEARKVMEEHSKQGEQQPKAWEWQRRQREAGIADMENIEERIGYVLPEHFDFGPERKDLSSFPPTTERGWTYYG